jgi:thimet oligopeptidase
MAKNAKTAHSFLLELVDNAKPKGAMEMGEMLELKRKMTNNYKADTINEWDWQYYTNQIKKQNYSVDYDKLKVYFPTERVLRKMLDFYGELFGVKFLRANVPLWDPKIYAFKMIENGKTAAYFYLDLYPREGKYQHAECEGVLKARILPDGTWQKPVAIIVMNVSNPTKDTPSLLTFEQYNTLFHESGHAMHEVLSKVKYGTLSGSNTARDFVEVPSMLMEGMSWEPAVINRVTGHYKDSTKKLPYAEVQKMLKVKTADSGTVYLRLFQRGLFDMIAHNSADAPDTTKLEEKVFQNIRMIPMSKGTHPQATFGHPMWGYDAQYYSYFWSEFIADDFLDYMKGHGGFNATTGKRLKDIILSMGSSHDELEQSTKFLGRKPNQKAMLKSLGFVY